MFVKQRPGVVEAHQWFKNGDHPNDRVGQREPDPFSWDGGYIRKEGAVVRYFRHPDDEFAGHKKHEACGFTWHQHGWIDTPNGGQTVCPTDWIITGACGEYYPVKDNVFRSTYEEVLINE